MDERNQKRKLNQIYNEEDDRQNDDVQADANDDDEQLPLSLSLGLTPYPSQISLPNTTTTTSSLRLAPPSPMITRPVPDFGLSRPFMTSSPPYTSSSLSNFTGFQRYSSIRPPFSNFFPQSAFVFPPSSNQTPARSVPPSTTESRRISPIRSQIRNRISNIDQKIPAPFPWATNIRGKIRSLEDLESKGITIITGDVQCKHCEKVYQISYNLREKFSLVEDVFVTRIRIMRERAQVTWTNPEPTRCELCGREKAVKPVIAEKKSKINWLFLLLGQTLGYCTLEQLKNFCKHAKIHRTGAKDRVLYLTYLGLCMMLQPNRDLFIRESRRR
ncbi:hypothetical protein AALP_AA4G067400 [Arabis alpina]|uniref:DUF7086 domain-containing protein n=1 Tax=Arabis alpina TaxID=50452 RepID=A0A087H1L7_ARAAL|nr:hypothetical protein AALP_AA4G067400 [Arabis alpina]